MVQIVRPVATRVRTMISRGIVKRIDDSKKLQTIQTAGFADGVRDGVERFQQYGFSSNPPPDSECILLAVGGQQGHVVAISVEDRTVRVKDIDTKDVALYTATNGIMVFVDDDGGVVHLGAKSAAEFVALADKVKSELDDIKSDIDAIKTHATTHIHPAPTGPTSATTNPLVTTWTPASVAATKVKAT